MANGINVMVALVLLYFMITCGVLLKKLRALNSLPYDRYQGAIVFYRLQVTYHGIEVFHATAASSQFSIVEATCASVRQTRIMKLVRAGTLPLGACWLC